MWFGRWCRDSLDGTPASDDMIPPLTQVNLLDKVTSPLSFTNGGLAYGDVLPAAFDSLLYKSRLRFLPLNTATVVRSMVSPAATALTLIQRGRTSTGEVEAPYMRCTGVCIRSSASCGYSAVRACIAAQLLEPRTTPPTLASHRVR